MCRLLAYLGEPTTVARLVFGGAHSLYEQSWKPKELLSGSVNADGYGVAWYAKDELARIAEVRPIWHDTDLERTLSAIESHCVFAALRNGTQGIPVDRSGLLPLVHDRWSFALNGFVPDFRTSHMRALRGSLPDDLYAALSGPSDSETLFYLAVAQVRGGATMVEGMAEAARKVKERVGRNEAQLNMVMTDGSTLAAIRSSTVLVTNSLYVAEHSPFAPGGVAIASEPPEAGAVWAPMDGHSWVEVDRSGAIRSDLLFLE
jgi:glutamine amidotransferase